MQVFVIQSNKRWVNMSLFAFVVLENLHKIARIWFTTKNSTISCVRDKKIVIDRILKLSPIHASGIYQNESSAHLGKTHPMIHTGCKIFIRP